MRKMAPTAARRRGGVGAAVLGRASPSTMEEEDVLEREREAPKAWIERPSFPHYI